MVLIWGSVPWSGRGAGMGHQVHGPGEWGEVRSIVSGRGGFRSMKHVTRRTDTTENITIILSTWSVSQLQWLSG